MAKQALITGASRGIGKEIAAVLAKEGYDLFLTCKSNIEQLQKYADELEAEHSIHVIARKCDAADPEQVEFLFQEIKELHILVNNAGISKVGLLTDLSVKEWNEILSANLSSVFYNSKIAARLMLQNHCGTIINISSVWGSVGASCEVAYSATKGGVEAFTRALAKELAPSGIRVNAIALGLIDTDMNRCFSPEDLDALSEEIPLGRMGTPKEAADLVLSLINAPDYLTGQIIRMDGGWC